LRQIQNPEYLRRVTHVIVDEAHERQVGGGMGEASSNRFFALSLIECELIL